jgi:hypothetical protein
VIGKSKGGERRCRLTGYTHDRFLATGLDQTVGDHIEISCHSASLAAGGQYFNYVLTTMC